MHERVFGGVVIALGAFYIWGATLITESFIQDPVGPKTFPYILGGLAILCGLVFIARPDENPDWPNSAGWMEIIAAAGVSFVYAFVLPEIGFVISTMFAAGYFSWRFGAKPVGAVITGIAISLGLFVVFKLILGLSLAKGFLGF